MSATPKKPKTLAETVTELPGRIFRREALNTLLLLAIGAGGLVYAQAHEKSSVDAGVAPIAADLAQHKRDEAKRLDDLERKVDLAEERSARRFEVLYNTILERRPQPGADELTKPQTDGGR